MDDLPLWAHRNANWAVKLALFIPLTTEDLDEITLLIEYLHAMVAMLGYQDISSAIHRHAPGMMQLDILCAHQGQRIGQ